MEVAVAVLLGAAVPSVVGVIRASVVAALVGESVIVAVGAAGLVLLEGGATTVSRPCTASTITSVALKKSSTMRLAASGAGATGAGATTGWPRVGQKA